MQGAHLRPVRESRSQGDGHGLRQSRRAARAVDDRHAALSTHALHQAHYQRRGHRQDEAGRHARQLRARWARRHRRGDRRARLASPRQLWLRRLRGRGRPLLHQPIDPDRRHAGRLAAIQLQQGARFSRRSPQRHPHAAHGLPHAGCPREHRQYDCPEPERVRAGQATHQSGEGVILKTADTSTNKSEDGLRSQLAAVTGAAQRCGELKREPGALCDVRQL
mmetsp:Transcript_20420/g.43799  ORF Transcript_20420/g.43799 Transcript_20420/m.43799 type:complete len:221 (-) Transcript_20420:216-878(-)